MINSGAFSNIDVLTKTADASWQRQNAITNNIANVDTPGYKRQDIEFKKVLERELRETMAPDLDTAVKNVQLNQLKGVEYTDSPGYSYRLDTNNVDIDTENVELASEQIRYQALTSSISQEVKRFSAVIK